MATGAPTFTTPNYHEFQPSQIETTLANALTNKQVSPNAFPLLQSYAAQRQANDAGYGAAIDQLHNMQWQEFQANNGIAKANLLNTSLKDAQNPSDIVTLQQLGVLPQGLDITGLTNDRRQNQQSDNMGKVLHGAGTAGIGGFTGLAPAVSSAIGSPVEQGTPAIVQAAAVNAAGRVAASGGDKYTQTSIDPNNPLVTNTHTSRNPIGEAAPSAAPSATGAAQSVPQIAARVMATLPKVAQTNPQVSADIMAGATNGQPTVAFDSGHNQYVVKGKSGHVYSAAAFMQ